MSSKTLGDRIGVSYQQVQKYEKGTNRITVSRVYALAEALGVDVTYFLRELGDAPELDPSGAAALTLKLNRAFLAIHDPDTRAEIIAHVEGIAATQRSN